MDKGSPSIIEIVPAHNGLTNLTYFSHRHYEVGQVVPVDLRGGKIPGLIVRISSVSKFKGSLKKHRFELKKINSVPTGLKLQAKLVEALQSMADYHMQSMASVLNLVLPRLSNIRVIMDHAKIVICVPNISLAKSLSGNGDEFITTVKNLVLLSGRIREIVVSDRPGAYRTPRDPGIDLKKYIEHFSHSVNARYTERMLINSVNETTHRSEPTRLIQIKGKTILSSELISFVQRAIKDQVSILLIVSRKGYSALTICSDCGELLLCKHCTAPLVLHVTKERKYKCHHCNYEEKITIHCRRCDNWKLIPMGMGLERVREELARIIPDSKTANIRITTLNDALNIASPIAYSAVVSIDSLFSIPDFSIREKIFYDLTTLRKMTTESMLVQTRHPNEPLFKFLTSGDGDGFRKSDLEIRRALNYPPFAMFIKVTHRGTVVEKRGFMAFAKNALKDYNPIITDAFIPMVARKYITHAIVKLLPDGWPDEKLRQILENMMSPKINVTIDPDNLL